MRVNLFISGDIKLLKIKYDFIYLGLYFVMYILSCLQFWGLHHAFLIIINLVKTYI